MKPTTRHQAFDLQAAGLVGWPFGGPSAVDLITTLRSCLALLAACGWLFSVGILWAAETSGSPSVAPSEAVFEVKQDLPITESVNAEPEVLRLLIWEGHAPDDWIERFEKQVESHHGRSVKLKITYVKGGEEFYDAIRDRAVDVVMMTHHAYKDERFKYIQNRLLLPINLANIPNFKHVIPEIRMAEYLSSERQIYAVPVSQGPYGLAYNTALLESEPQSWNIFWDPQFKRQYVL
ncbi:MAG: extracellular solute-binding protein, partial [Desulfofustis sp.]|nr:extracellular solute-binding protein [Desulfofustis sp.]